MCDANLIQFVPKSTNLTFLIYVSEKSSKKTRLTL